MIKKPGTENKGDIILGSLRANYDGSLTIPSEAFEELELEDGDSIEFLRIPGREGIVYRKYGDKTGDEMGLEQVAVVPLGWHKDN
jgi:bifunctional DNA-binding transcriptional regulator/antitoxin component of YhaV-PrlF toxin-antitoxin module